MLKIILLLLALLCISGCTLMSPRPTAGEGGCTITPVVLTLADGTTIVKDKIDCNVTTPRGPDEPGTFDIFRNGHKLAISFATGMGGAGLVSAAMAMAGPWQMVGLVVVLAGVGTLILKYLPMGPVVTPIKLLLGDLPKNASFLIIACGVGIAFVPVFFEKYSWVPIVVLLGVGGYFLWEWRANNSTRKRHEANGHSNGSTSPPNGVPAEPTPAPPEPANGGTGDPAPVPG